MTKLKIFAFISTILLLANCTNTDSFWDAHDGLDNFTPGCLAAQNALSGAAVNYANATDENYSQMCELYRQALQLAIDSCGASAGNYQALLNDLGDCSGNGDDPDPNPNSQFEADLNGEHFAAASGGVVAGITSMNVGGENLTAFQIAGANASATITLQFDGTLIYEGSVISGQNEMGLIIGYLDTTNPEEYYSSTDFVGDNDNNSIVTITSINYATNTISGTFSGTLYNFTDNTQTLEVTNGVFNAVTFSNTSNQGTSFDGFMNLDYDGTSYMMSVDDNSDVDNGVSAFYFNIPTGGSFYVINGVKFSPSGHQIWSIKFPYDANGTLGFNGNDVLASYTYFNSGSTTVYDQNSSGTLNITNNTSSNVAGTFNFTVQNESGNTIEVTNGEFSFNF